MSNLIEHGFIGSISGFSSALAYQHYGENNATSQLIFAANLAIASPIFFSRMDQAASFGLGFLAGLLARVTLFNEELTAPSLRI